MRFILLIIPVFLFSCKKNETSTTSDSCSVEINHKLMNHYTMAPATMRMAHPSHSYMKLYISDIGQYRLLEEQGAFLLDHPFDAIPDKNFQYTTEHTSSYGVYYGVLPYGTDLKGIQAEKISDLYMSDPSLRMSGEGKQFTGTVRFFDPVDSTVVPLKGMKVIIRDVTKIASGITDSLGNFSISSDIVADTVEVLLKFDNDYLEIHTLDLASLSSVFGTNIFSLGFKRSCAFTNFNIEIGRQYSNAALHHSAAALHALNEYKIFAQQNGFLFPDKKFLFWLGKDAAISTHFATPMLRNMALQNIGNPEQLLENLFGIPANVASVLAALVKDQLPDLYAPYLSRYSNAARASFIETMFHELSHAAHYAKVGPAYWMPYVEYIYQHGGYGEASFSNSGIISLSEAWAEDLSNIGLNYIYGNPKYLGYDENNDPYWIPYGLYYDLSDTGTNEPFDFVSGITFPQVYNQFDVNVNSLPILKDKLKTANPLQQASIDTLFSHYGY